MPQLQFHGIDTQAIQQCSQQLVDDLCQAMDTTPDNFLLEVIHSTQILSGEIVPPSRSSMCAGSNAARRPETEVPL
nr:DUF1904 family protein [Nitrincola sp. A-D6]